MVSTRSKTGALQPKVDAAAALQSELNTYTSQSLLSWSARSRTKKGQGSAPRPPQSAPILNLPLDILATIFSACHPLSLLQLSRTSWDLRAFLTSKSSQAIWIGARKLLTHRISPEDAKLSTWPSIAPGIYELPGCPSFMSEPAYAELLYVGICTLCRVNPAGGNGQGFNGSLLANVCRRCHNTSFVSKKMLLAEWKEDVDDRIFDILPHLSTYRRRSRPRHTERCYPLEMSQAIFQRALDFEMHNRFDFKVMNAFYERGRNELKEREEFESKYTSYTEAERAVRIITEVKRERAAQARYTKNVQFAIQKLQEEESMSLLTTDFDDTPRSRTAIRSLLHELNDETWAAFRSQILADMKSSLEQRQFMELYFSDAHKNFRQILQPFRDRLNDAKHGCRFLSRNGPKLRTIELASVPAAACLIQNPDFVDGTPEQRNEIWKVKEEDIVKQLEGRFKKMTEELLELVSADLEAKRVMGGNHARLVAGINVTPKLLKEPYFGIRCISCGTGPFPAKDLYTHQCFNKYDLYGMPKTLERLRTENHIIISEYSSPTRVAGNPCIKVSWEKCAVAKRMIEAMVKAGSTAPASIKHFFSRAGNLTCEECSPGVKPELRQASSVVAFLNHHCTGYFGYETRMLHTKFTFIPPPLPVVKKEEESADEASKLSKEGNGDEASWSDTPYESPTSGSLVDLPDSDDSAAMNPFLYGGVPFDYSDEEDMYSD